MMNAIESARTDKTDTRLLLLSPTDNVFVLRGVIQEGEQIYVGGKSVAIERRIDLGHKLARTDIQADAKLIKYGAPIGSTTVDIACGEHVHTHNMKSDYTPTYTLDDVEDEVASTSEMRNK